MEIRRKTSPAQTPQTTGVIDYNQYVMGKKEKQKYVILAGIAFFALGYIFFNHLVIGAIVSLGAFLYPKFKARELMQKRKAELNIQFKDALYSLASSLSVGRSLESAMLIALKDLRILYEEDAYIIREFTFICRRIELNEPVEIALSEFAKRSGLEDIKNFADVLTICKKTGGNLVQVVKNTSNIISDKIEIYQDIEMLLAKQKYEQKLLNYMPFIFIALVRYGGGGYMDPLYASFKGYLFMGIALVILVLAYFVSQKIFEIKV
jgi:tight adherence protein B